MAFGFLGGLRHGMGDLMEKWFILSLSFFFTEEAAEASFSQGVDQRPDR